MHLLLAGDGPLIRPAEEAGARVSVVPMPAALAGLGDSELDKQGPLGRIIGLLRSGLAAAPAAWGYVGRCAGRSAGWRRT